jgi:hypothetical protein
MSLGPLVAWLRNIHHTAIERNRLQRVSEMSPEEYAMEQLLSSRELAMLDQIMHDPTSSAAARADAEQKVAAHAVAARLHSRE